MKKIPIIFLISGTVFSLFYFLSWPVIILKKQGEIIFVRPVKPGDTFLLGYLHSVAKSDVWEKFRINDAYQIVLTETMFQGQGAGLPSTLADNEKLIRDGPWFKVTGMKRIVPVINWQVDSQWQNRFRFGQEEIIPVATLTGDGLVQIKLLQMKLIDWLKYYLKKFSTGEEIKKIERNFSERRNKENIRIPR